jgi:spermidine synthase
MKPTVLRDRATTPDGAEMTLHERDGVLTIRVAGVELMSSRQHHSEERLAELACAGLRDRPGARVLVGGLGMGFTLRAALAQLAPDAAVVVAELMPAVIRWNRAAEYGLGADALADPRVELVEGDVADVLRAARGRFDAVILDVDNGADGLTVAANDGLYAAAGLAAARAALRPGGRLAVWSAGDDPAFAERLGRAGLAVTVERARVHAGGGGWTTLFLGCVPAAG